jgi:predicted chitinase
MNDPIQPAVISAALGVSGPIGNVRANWPLIYAALQKQSIDDVATQIAAIATVGVETGCFSPIKERGGPAYFTKMYEANLEEAKRLGNSNVGDGPLFRGRGYIQITGRTNYTNYGREIGVDLCSDPDQALDPEVAGHVLAIYFRDHRIPSFAALGKWESVRRSVNGGLNGWASFLSYVQDLSKAIALTSGGAEPKPAETIGVIGDVQT